MLVAPELMKGFVLFCFFFYAKELFEHRAGRRKRDEERGTEGGGVRTGRRDRDNKVKVRK